MRGPSHAVRARLHEERRESDAAREHFRLFHESRSWPDELTVSWLERGDEGLVAHRRRDLRR